MEVPIKKHKEVSCDGVVHRMRLDYVWWETLCALHLTTSTPCEDGTPVTCLKCLALCPSNVDS